MAEASGGRTHRRQANLPPAGFEDRDNHRTACASIFSFSFFYIFFSKRVIALLRDTLTTCLSVLFRIFRQLFLISLSLLSSPITFFLFTFVTSHLYPISFVFSHIFFFLKVSLLLAHSLEYDSLLLFSRVAKDIYFALRDTLSFSRILHLLLFHLFCLLYLFLDLGQDKDLFRHRLTHLSFAFIGTSLFFSNSVYCLFWCASLFFGVKTVGDSWSLLARCEHLCAYRALAAGLCA